jgi:poly(A) polymerase
LSAIQRQAVQSLLRIAPVVDELGARFAAAGHEIALVGGPVRDILLDRGSKDLDFATSARPDAVERLGYRQGVRHHRLSEG